MKGVPWVDFQQIIERELGETFSRCGLAPNVSLIRAAGFVADGASVYSIGNDVKRAILLISPSEFPEAVAREQSKAASMRSHLEEELGSVILIPLALGYLRTRSYALLPLCQPFSSAPSLWILRRFLTEARVLEWVRAVTTRHNAPVETQEEMKQFIAPLEFLRVMPDADAELRIAASIALDRLNSARFVPRFVPMHNDLWKGNILRPPRGALVRNERYQFRIIDWGGSRIGGFPIYDLVRVALSFNLRPNRLSGEIAYATRILGCERVDARSYLAAALGEIAMRSDQFPVQEFFRLARDCFAKLRTIGL